MNLCSEVMLLKMKMCMFVNMYKFPFVLTRNEKCLTHRYEIMFLQWHEIIYYNGTSSSCSKRGRQVLLQRQGQQQAQLNRGRASVFSCTWYPLPAFSALGTGYNSQVLPRLAPNYEFSRALHQLHIFPRLAPVARFSIEF